MKPIPWLALGRECDAALHGGQYRETIIPAQREILLARRAHVDAVDARAERSAPAGLGQRRNGIRVARKHGLDAAVVPVAHEARQAARAGFARRPLPEADALDAAFD